MCSSVFGHIYFHISCAVWVTNHHLNLKPFSPSFDDLWPFLHLSSSSRRTVRSTHGLHRSKRFVSLTDLSLPFFGPKWRDFFKQKVFCWCLWLTWPLSVPLILTVRFRLFAAVGRRWADLCGKPRQRQGQYRHRCLKASVSSFFQSQWCFFPEQSDLDSLGVYGAGVRVWAAGTVLSFYKGLVCVNWFFLINKAWWVLPRGCFFSTELSWFILSNIDAQQWIWLGVVKYCMLIRNI